MRRFSTILVIALPLLFLVSISSAQQTSSTAVPNLIRYSGTLKDAQGAAFSSAPLGVTFAIYKQQDSGAAVWLETQNVSPDSNGQYSVVLGSTTAKGIPNDLFSQQEERWLGVQVQGQAEQSRVLLVSVPYAFKAYDAETLGGLPASAFVKAGSSEVATTSTDTGSSQGVGTTVNAFSTTASVKTKAPLQPLSLTLNHVPVFDGNNLVDSLMTQPTDGTATQVDIKGNINLLSDTYAYWIGGTKVLTINDYNDNLVVGGYQGANSSGRHNTFLGGGAGHANTSGSYNTFSGTYAGTNNMSGAHNTFLGEEAGLANSTGSDNTYTGSFAGLQNQTGSGNTFTGSEAGVNSKADYNTFFGTVAGYSNTTGERNTFNGVSAGYNYCGSQNTFSGYEAGKGQYLLSGLCSNNDKNTGSGNAFYGYQSGTNNNAGEQNAFFGYQSGMNNTNGSHNVYIANPGPPYFGPTENETIRIGTQDGDFAQKATYIAGIYDAATNPGAPVFIDSTGKLGTKGGPGLVTKVFGRTGEVVAQTGDYNFAQIGGDLGDAKGTLANGQLSGMYTNPVTLSNPLSSFTGNTFTGGTFIGDGSGLTGIVPAAGSPNYIQNGTATQGGANFNISGNGTANSLNSATNYQIGGASVLSIGHLSLSNVLVGVDAGTNNTTGSNSVFLGYRAGYSNTTGAYNIFSGYKAGYSNTTGASNVFFGYLAGYSNTDSSNTFVGGNAGRDHAAGAGNTFTGDSAGKTLTGGSNNTLYGYHTGSQSASFTGNNNIYIGAFADFNVGTGNNNIDIGNRGVAGDKSTIRLGQQGTQNAIYIAGIAGVTAGDSDVCVVTVGDNTGQLGVCNPANQPAGDLQTELQKQQSVVAPSRT